MRKQLVLLERVEALLQSPNLRKIATALKVGRYAVGRLQSSLQDDDGSQSTDAMSRFFTLLLRLSSVEHVGGRLMLKQPETMFSTLEELSDVVGDGKQSDMQKLERIIVASSATYGHESIQVAQWKYLLSELLGDAGDFKSKRETLLEVLKIQQQELGFDSLFIAWTLKGLAHADGHLGNLERKHEYLRRAFELQEEELGQAHPQTLVTLHFQEDVEEQIRRLKDPDGSMELVGLFGRQVPPNQKVNRYLPRDEQFDLIAVSKLKSADIEPPKRFLMKAYGGGACDVGADAGLRVPFYFNS